MSVTPLHPRLGLTPSAARALTDKLKQDVEGLWFRLLDAYERGVHTALGYSSWGDYFKHEFGAKSTSQAYRLLDAARVAKAIEAHSPQGERAALKSEKVVRELVPVLRTEGEEAVAEAWADVVEEHGPEPTPEEVRTTVSAKKKKLSSEQKQFSNVLSGLEVACEHLHPTLAGRTAEQTAARERLLRADEETLDTWRRQIKSIDNTARQLRRLLGRAT